MKRLELKLKRYRSELLVDLSPVFSIYYLGKEGPSLPFFFAITLFKYEFGIDKEFITLHETYDEEPDWDIYRFWIHNLTTGKVTYLPKK